MNNERKINIPLKDSGVRQEDKLDHLAFLRLLFDKAVDAVSAHNAMPLIIPRPKGGRTVIIAAGKAAAEMAYTAASRLGENVEALVITCPGYGIRKGQLPARFEVIEAGHPVPNQTSIEMAKHALDIADSLGPNDLLLSLMSGGGSSLLSLPAPEIALSHKQDLTRMILRSGANITDLNCVRTHLSRIKGGRLAIAAAPARVVTYIISDVPGDDPAQVASGPTVPGRCTLAQARSVMHRFELVAPDVVMQALANPENERPPADTPGLADAETHIIAKSADALQAARDYAEPFGWRVINLGDDLSCDAASLGREHAALVSRLARQGGRYLLLSGGETTVDVDSGAAGQGGRNTEYLLSLALGLKARKGVWALACDTDGLDGTTGAAGAIIGPDILSRADAAGLDAEFFLRSHDSGRFFEDLAALVDTGPTCTNVNDFRAILIDTDGSQS